MKIYPTALSFVLLLALAGCDRATNRDQSGLPRDTPPADESEGWIESDEGAVGVRLSADPAVVTAGESVGMRVENRGDLPVEYGRPLMVEHWSGGEWVETADSHGRMWTMELLTVPPGEAGVVQSWPFPDTPLPEAGWYRFSKRVHVPESQSIDLRARIEVNAIAH